MKRVLCIWFPDWPIQRLRAARSELQSRAIVLHARDPRRGQRVVACDQIARQQGIRIGMSLAEVSALSRTAALSRRGCEEMGLAPNEMPNSNADGIHLEEHDAQEDRTVLEQLAVWCECFSPIVGLESGKTPTGLLLDITGLASLFGSENQLAQHVMAGFGQRGYQVRVAVADTIGAAWAVARFGKNFCVVPEGGSREALRILPIECLRLPDKTVGLLHKLGVQYVEQLMALPRAGLASRLGDELINRLDQSLGEKGEVVVAHRPRPALEACWVLEHPTDRRDALEAILARLTGHLGQLLAAQDHGAVRVDCQFDCGKQPVNIQVGLFQPTADARHVCDLLRMQLEVVNLRQPVSKVRLRATITVRMKEQQHELWNDPFQATTIQLASLIERLSSRLGPRQVLRAWDQPNALPERAYREVPLTETRNRQSSSRRDSSQSSSFLPLERPLWLQHPPLPLPMVSVAIDGPPLCFDYQNQRHEVTQRWGPERIETGWWRGQCIRRDYYRVATADGSRFWLFRRLTDGQWFLHGCFE